MNRWGTALLIPLLIQCGIVAAVFWPDTSPNHYEKRAFAPFPVNAIDELRIGDEYDNEVVLRRTGNIWLLPNLENLPANSTKVSDLLHTLTTQSGSWPIADSPAARQRFQVADYYYQKRLSLFSGGEKLGTIYLGTSPGFRKIHARNDKQDAIYSINLDPTGTRVVEDAWIDDRLLQVRAPLRIDSDLYNLYFENGNWQSATGGNPDQQELRKLIAALKNLQVEGVADEDLQRELSVTEADLVLNIQSLAGDVTLKLVSLDGNHYIYSSEFPLFFKCSNYDFNQLTGIDARLVSGEPF
ncbi:Uncharacterised protein [Halioglobus japonicus]|nr:Uncharacterised protein [Halioglobus japonicus]